MEGLDPRISVIPLDTEWETISHESAANPGSAAAADDPAYIIYTSGSTGQPKGVEVTHRALANFVAAAREMFALEPGDRVLQFASLAFDASAEEIFPCLAGGATLVLRTDWMVESASLFLQKCHDWGVTVLDLPTVYWHELTENLASEQLTLPADVRLVIIGGERAAPERLAIWRRRVGSRVRLLNTYGPTEGTVVSTAWESTGYVAESAPIRQVPIGRPIANVQTYVLDRNLNPVPIGVSGELHIAGAGLARAYFDCPDLTAEKFIPNPFSSEPGSRLYKTGDLGRYLADGNIEFLQRIDTQVKIRGFRIELGEIEAALNQHPAVREAVVVARADTREEPHVVENPKSKIQNPKSDNRLVAYIVSIQDRIDAGKLRAFLQAKLPDYMLPSVFVFLDSLPLTPSGKIDRKALPAPDQSRPELESAFVAPRTRTEELLAGIWAEVLKLEGVGIHDNFFELGGHSLLATQVISRVRKAFQVELPLRSLFETPTVAGLAARVAQKEAPPQDTASVLAQLESLSDEEAQLLLAQESTKAV
jgi:amino acid adenylation domain-containing protein